MKDVLVGLWSRNSHESRESLARTIIPLSKAIQKTSAQAAALVKQKGEMQSIFVGPEFLFTASERHPDSTGMTQNTRNWVLQKVQKMSQENPNMVLIPGTIVFKEAISEMSAKRAILNLQHAIDPKPLAEKRKQAIKPYLTYESADKTTESSQELYRSQIEALTPYEKNQMSRSARLLAGNFLIKNRTYVFFKGEKKFSYGKKCNMGDFNNDNERGIFVPGRHEGVTTIDGLRVGFEICLDHSLGTLKNHLAAADLDLHIIVSAEVNNNPSYICVGDGGYLIHASANEKFSKVLRKLPMNARRTNANPFRTQRVTQKTNSGTDVTEFEVGDSSPAMSVGGDILETKDFDNKTYEVVKPLSSVDIDNGLLKFYLLQGLK